MPPLFALVLSAVLAAQDQIGTGRITGRVIEEGIGTPIAGARVMLLPERPPRTAPFEPPPQAVTDADGRYAFEGLAPGRYRLSVQQPGYVQQAPFTPPPVVELGPDRMQVQRDLALQRGAVITGRIVDQSGRPVAEARVAAMRRLPVPGGRLGMAGSPSTTNDLGEFRLYGLAAGEYVIQAAPRFEGPVSPAGAQRPSVLAPTFYGGTTDPATALPVTVATGQTVSEIVFGLLPVPAFQISGVVVDDAGAPVVDAMVTLMGDMAPSGIAMPGGPGGRARTDATGRFTIPNVIGGTYVLRAAAPVRSPAVGAGTAGASGGVVSGTAGPLSSGGGGIGWATETRDGVTTQYRFDAEREVRITVTDANVVDVRVVVR